ncbi:MAG TPA: LysE family transporter [Steroidobacteraceae bacterium]|nr:LysE family transporter [Steroidobacteraceae bacterium]
MGIPFLIKGLLIGLSIAAPLGPIGILCAQRTLTEGARMGLICGLGAATADALYALAGAVALSAIGQWIIDDQLVLRLLGGIFLVYLGARTFIRPAIVVPATARMPGLPAGAHAAFMSTFLLTLANPMTLLGFAAVFAGLGVAPAGLAKAADSQAAPLVLGVFLGSAAWWLALSSLVGRLRAHIGPRALAVINRVSGTVLTAFGLHAMAALLPLS